MDAGSVVGVAEVHEVCKEHMNVEEDGMNDAVEVFDALSSPLVHYESGSRRIRW